MKLLILTIFFCLISLPYARAEEDLCPTVDLNAAPNSPFKQIPIYDQDGTESCYAFAASQMVDYYRIKNGDKSYGLTNPVYASWAAYYKNRTFLKSNSLGYGSSPAVIEAIRAIGVCSEQDVAKRLSALKKEANITDAELLYYLETMYKHYNGFFPTLNWSMARQELNDYVSMTCVQADDLRTQLKKSNLFGIAPTMVLEKLFGGCKNVKVKIPKLENTSFGTNEDMKNALNRSFAHELPAQVKFCSNIFKDSSYRGLYGTSLPLLRSTNFNSRLDCANHAAIISGQTKIAGECHYLIRNSYGSYWYPAGATSCACITREGQYKTQCKPGEGKEYVGCWFKTKTVLSNLGEVSAFK